MANQNVQRNVITLYDDKMLKYWKRIWKGLGGERDER